MARRVTLWSIVWIALIAGALAVDAAAATFVHVRGWDQKPPGLPSALREFFKIPGFFPTTVVIVALVGWRHRLHWRGAFFLLLATLPAALNEPIKWIVGRLRPFKGWHNEWLATAEPFKIRPMPTPINHMFNTQNMSFPSGHAALAYATAAAMAILFPRRRIWFFAAACCVGVERICENAHWCSDVVAAAALGIGGVELVAYFASRGNGLLVERPDHGIPV